MLKYLKNRVVLIAILAAVIVAVVQNKDKIEGFGSAYWHRPNLEETRKFMSGVFNPEEKQKHLNQEIEEFTNGMDSDITGDEEFNPNSYVISKYPVEREIVRKDLQLEAPEFSTPELYYEDDEINSYSDPKHISSNDTGSGDLKELTGAFDGFSKDQFYKNLDHLKNRGANRSSA